MEAYILAHQYGADGIELDVQLSSDGEIVVIHDEKIDRTSNGKGFVRDYTIKKLKSYNYNRTRPEHARADIPTLREVLTYIRGTEMKLNIELKTGLFFYPGIEKKTVDMVHEFGMSDRVIYSSFNHYSIRNVQQLDPDAQVGLLHDVGFIDVPGYASRLGVNALHPRWQCLQYPNYLEDSRRYNLQLNTWTINQEDVMRKMCEVGVHAIITNYPDRAIRVRNAYEKKNGFSSV